MRLLPKTPKKKKSPSSAYKTPQKTAEKSSEELATELPFSDQVGESPWKISQSQSQSHKKTYTQIPE